MPENMIYAGIGSRQTPEPICNLFTHLGEWFGSHGLTLRSGHADGADIAFERGCVKSGGSMEIYLPWSGFNGSKSNLVYRRYDGSTEIARELHPSFDTLPIQAKMLHARNSYQILGYDLGTPCDFVACWTPGGGASGGTGQAIRLAKQYNVPVFDFGVYREYAEAKQRFNDFYKALRDAKRKEALL